jgi:hypothetical protein
MNACFNPASRVGKARVYFRPETLSTWYYVDMGSDAPCHAGVLLKPSKSLIEKKIFYYIDVQGDGTGRTPEYAPIVVGSEAECKTRIAPVSATGPAAVFPAIPPGFVGGGISTGVIAGGVAAAAVIGGGAAVLKSDDDDPAPTTTVPVTSPPATTPPVTVPPTTTPSPGAGLVVACQASPRTGEAPLRVDFATFPNGGTGTYTFEWAFGDGGESTNPNPAHTFLNPGVFNSTVVVRSGSQTASCSRPITVTRPPTPPPGPAPVTLTVSLTGTGTGVVTGPGITCAPDCGEAYASGTVVTLAAAPTSGSTFVGWSGGGCSGTGACTVTMDVSKTVTAQFELLPVTLTVARTGTGTGGVTGTGINCGPDCTESYAPGTMVTLTATPTGGSTFGGWSGGGCTGTGTCVVTMDVSKTVTAQFNAPAPVTLTFTALDETGAECGAPLINIAPPNTDCVSSSAGTTCTHSYTAGTVVNLSYDADLGCECVRWSGACAATPTVPGEDSVCTLTMNADQTAGATFDFSCFLSVTSRSASSRPVTGSTQLDLPGGEGQLVINGRMASAVRPGPAALTVEGQRGTNIVEAALVRGAGRPGTWRFDFSGEAAIKAGSLRVIAGTVAVITGHAVVFRLQGKPGERVVFAFEVE